tara:strand:- start:258 stop:410 length:153 start_codon:yes stop_codon:yes gene_type:complete
MLLKGNIVKLGIAYILIQKKEEVFLENGVVEEDGNVVPENDQREILVGIK